MNRLFRSRFKDPWLLLGLLIAVLGIGLIIIPQLRIFISSAEQEKGRLSIRTLSGGIIEGVPDAAKGLRLIEGSATLTIARGQSPLVTLKGVSDGLLEVYGATGQDVSGEVFPEGTLRVTGDGFDLLITQEVFRSSIFERAITPAPFTMAQIDPSRLAVTYHSGAYLNVVEREPTQGFDNYRRFLSENRYLSAIKNSLIVAVSATILASILAISLAYLFARYRFPGKSAFITLITMASISPPFLGGYAWRMLLGSQGILTRLLNLDFTIVGLHGVIWVITWLIFPLIFLLTYDSLTAIDNSLVEASMSLGASKRTTLFRVIIPLSMPGIITGAYLGMMTAFSDFGTPYVISLNLNVLPVLVYQEFMNEVGTNFPLASTGSVIMILISSAILMVQRFYLATKSYASIASRSTTLIEPSRGQKYLILTFSSFLIFLAFVPHLTVALTSLLQWRSGIVSPIWTVENYIRMFRFELNSIYVSFILGLSATVLNVVFGVAIAYIIVRKRFRFLSDFLNVMVMVPYIIPGTVLAIGFVMIFNQPPILITGTAAILILAYFVRKLPYSVKTAESVLYQIHPDLEEAAKSLGAKPARSFFDVTLKLMMGGVISGATLSFLQIMTEISSTIILYRPPWKPMTAVIFENTIRAGSDFGVASAMTVVLMLCLYIPLFFITKRTRMNRKGDYTLGAH